MSASAVGTASDRKRCRLYLVTPPALDPRTFADVLREALAGGDVACVQLRMKDASPSDVLGACELLLPVCRERRVPFLVNDDPALAVEADADGVHVGADDASAAEARSVVGPERIVGASCYGSRHLAMEAAEQGADYVAFGAFFPTTTKEPRARPAPALLGDWSATTTLPSVAIGGVTPENCGELAKAGADFVAAVSAVWGHPDGPKAAVSAFGRVLERQGVPKPDES